MNNNKIIGFKIYRLGKPVEIVKACDIDMLYDEIMQDVDVMKVEYIYGDDDENN